MLQTSALLSQIDWKVIAQVVSGGVAGAMLTFILNQTVARKRLAQINVSVSRTDYSIPANDTDLRSVEVSYGGRTFEKLLLYEFTVRNVSTRATKVTPFLFLLPRDTEVVDRSCTIYPVHRPDLWEERPGAAAIYFWDPGELMRDDYAVLRVLFTPATNVEWKFRGEDDIRVVSEDAEIVADLQADTRLITAWVALFLIVGVLPFGSALVRGLLIWASTPFLVNRIAQWRAALDRQRRRRPDLNVAMQDVSVAGDLLIENGRARER